jgi:hypothetical protein
MSNLDNRVKQLESIGDSGLTEFHVYMWGDDPGMVKDKRTGEQMTRAEFDRRMTAAEAAGEKVYRITRESVLNNG